jgi:hypothetical protein
LVARASTASKIDFGTPAGLVDDHQQVARMDTLKRCWVVVSRRRCRVLDPVAVTRVASLRGAHSSERATGPVDTFMSIRRRPQRSSSGQGLYRQCLRRMAITTGPHRAPDRPTLTRRVYRIAPPQASPTRRRSRVTSRTVTLLPHHSTASRTERPSPSVIASNAPPARRSASRIVWSRSPSAVKTSTANLSSRRSDRRVLYAVPPAHLTLSVAPPASPTADSSHLPIDTRPLSTPAFTHS